MYLGVHLGVDDVVGTCAPVAVTHGLAGSDDMFAHALWGTHQTLSLTGSQLLVERLADHAPPGVELMSCTITVFLLFNINAVLIFHQVDVRKPFTEGFLTMW